MLILRTVVQVTYPISAIHQHLWLSTKSIYRGAFGPYLHAHYEIRVTELLDVPSSSIVNSLEHKRTIEGK